LSVVVATCSLASRFAANSEHRTPRCATGSSASCFVSDGEGHDSPSSGAPIPPPAIVLTHFASAEHVSGMTHQRSIPVFAVVLQLLRDTRPLVACLALAACSANDSDSGGSASPLDTGTPTPTESINAGSTPTGAGGGAAAPSFLDCDSATPPKEDIQAFVASCRARAASARKKGVSRRSYPSEDASDVYSRRTTVAELNFADVPTWSDADINAEFASVRDERYLTQTSPPEPGFQRRMSWLYPDDGCYARAEQVDVRVAQVGKTRPYKLFAFGPLRVYTSNAPSGVVRWWYHVVPVVKNEAAQPIVLDPAVSPCQPLPYQKWLALMIDDVSAYDDLENGNGVALGDSWSYNLFSLSSGEPPHSAESLDDLQGIYLFSEWSRQTELGRDPNLVLGDRPPWSGQGCLSAD